MMDRNIPPRNSAYEGRALLIVDMISDFGFEDGEKLFNNSLHIVENLSSLKQQRFKACNGPVIYVNDELGNGPERLQEDLQALENRSEKAAKLLSLIRPEADDHWIVKPQRSGFYATSLGNLLLSLEVNSVIVAGMTTDICVLFTAHDAYMRGYSVTVPTDCCAAVEESHHDEAIRFLKRVAKADTSSSTSDRWNNFFGRAKSDIEASESVPCASNLSFSAAFS